MSLLTLVYLKQEAASEDSHKAQRFLCMAMVNNQQHGIQLCRTMLRYSIDQIKVLEKYSKKKI